MSNGVDWHFVRTDLSSPITEFVVLLVGRSGDEVFPIGSGVFLTQTLILTARHVVEEFWRLMGTGQPLVEGRERQLHFTVVAVQFPGESDESAIWEATTYAMCTFTDIALISVEPQNDLAKSFMAKSLSDCRKSLTINADPPQVGETVACIGYPNSLLNTVDGPSVSLKVQLHTSSGTVRAVYPEFRDLGMLRFPCFEFESLIIGGMSGGPIFNQAGQLCGLICSNHNGEPISYGVSLWPALGMQIRHNGPEVQATEPYSVWRLAELNLFGLLNFDNYKKRAYLETDPNGRQLIKLR